MKLFTPVFVFFAALPIVATALPVVVATLFFMPLPGTAQAAPAVVQTVPAQPALTGFPFTDEDLNYSINWPTGQSLGEAHLHAKRAGANWNLGFTVDAGIPGFAVKDSYHSDIVPDFCSTSFDRSTVHGSRTVKEKETIDRERGIATRVITSANGGTSDIPVPACVKDALAYLFYARRELGQGRVPAAQQILLGGLYQIRMDYDGAEVIALNGKQVQTDKMTCTATASSHYSFDIYFARDAARTPLLITAPFAVGKFSMELIR